MKLITILLSAFILILSCACATDGPRSDTDTPPINLLPMYGYPDVEKSEKQKKADERFIRAAVETSETRENASRKWAAEGWRYHRKGDSANAMRRFNQAWLLNPDYYMPYWGFGALLIAEREVSDATPHFDKALSLIDDDGEKPRLLTDAAKAYAALGASATKEDEARQFYGKANFLFQEAITIDPKYCNAYRAWAVWSYTEKSYTMAWKNVKKARTLKGCPISSRFLNALSEKLPEKH